MTDDPREIFWLHAEPVYEPFDELVKARLVVALDAALAAAGLVPPPPTTPDGNRPDSCGHCELLPTVNGAIVRAVHSSCPTHAGITSTRPQTELTND